MEKLGQCLQCWPISTNKEILFLQNMKLKCIYSAVASTHQQAINIEIMTKQTKSLQSSGAKVRLTTLRDLSDRSSNRQASSQSCICYQTVKSIPRDFKLEVRAADCVDYDHW